MKGIDHELLQDLDRHLRGSHGDAPLTAPEASNALIARAANAFEQELAGSQADLAKVIELVRTNFGTLRDASSAGPEDPTPR